MLTAIVVASIVAFVSPIVGALAQPFIADMRRKRVLARLMAEPLYAVGERRFDVRSPNYPDLIVEDGYIESISKGRVVFRHRRGEHTYSTPFTGAEVEDLIISARMD